MTHRHSLTPCLLLLVVALGCASEQHAPSSPPATPAAPALEAPPTPPPAEAAPTGPAAEPVAPPAEPTPAAADPTAPEPAKTNSSAPPASAAKPNSGTCRNPSEPGCTKCCVPKGKGAKATCVEREWTGGASSTVTPWYNASHGLEGACPEACPVCARCSTRDEQELLERGCRADCNCKKQRVGIDPCYHPDSCACYCERISRLAAACPDVKFCAKP